MDKIRDIKKYISTVQENHDFFKHINTVFDII